MTDYIHHKPTKTEKEARRAQRAAQQERERAEKIAALPDKVHDIPVIDVSYTAVGKKRVKELRRSFGPQRKAFLQNLAKTQAPLLKALGLSDKAVAEMGKGNAPNGYNVHHKLPLAGGGKNEFSNFILIKNDPYHTDIHKVSDLQICKMQEGETKIVKMPVPDGSIFIPPSEKQRVQAALKQPVLPSVLQKMQLTR